MSTREGGCLCGAARYSVSGEPVRIGICHCQDCRRTSGSAFNFFAVWNRADFESTGELSSFDGRSFCPRCGSRVASIGDDEVEIMVGTLDQAPSGLLPRYELWTPRREEWMSRLPWADQFERDRTVHQI